MSTTYWPPWQSFPQREHCRLIGMVAEARGGSAAIMPSRTRPTLIRRSGWIEMESTRRSGGCLTEGLAFSITISACR